MQMSLRCRLCDEGTTLTPWLSNPSTQSQFCTNCEFMPIFQPIEVFVLRIFLWTGCDILLAPSLFTPSYLYVSHDFIFNYPLIPINMISQVALVVKNWPANSGNIKRRGFNPWVRKIPWGGDGNPFQFSCLKNPMERGAWQATVQWVAELDMTEAT